MVYCSEQFCENLCYYQTFFKFFNGWKLHINFSNIDINFQNSDLYTIKLNINSLSDRHGSDQGVFPGGVQTNAVELHQRRLLGRLPQAPAGHRRQGLGTIPVPRMPS